MEKYKFTQNWFDDLDLLKFLNLSNDEIHVLEIGSFEGKSTVWFLENLIRHKNSTITCIDPWTNFTQNSDSINTYDAGVTDWDFKQNNTKNIFLNNIEKTEKSNQVIVKQGLSHIVLPELLTKNKKYDFIYIDGNHTSSFVLTDAVFSWYLLKKNGIMVFDDYLWEGIGIGDSLTLKPKIAVDSFINSFSDYIEVILDGYKKGIKKIK
jgi:predicted O-methyltransferase YrrM